MRPWPPASDGKAGPPSLRQGAGVPDRPARMRGATFYHQLTTRPAASLGAAPAHRPATVAAHGFSRAPAAAPTVPPAAANRERGT